MKGRGVMNLAYSRPLGVHSREGKNWLGIGGGGGLEGENKVCRVIFICRGGGEGNDGRRGER